MIECFTITDRAEWLAWRRQDVTASDVGACLGVSPWKSPLQLWAEKTGQVVEQHETPLMRRGRWLEPAVLTALGEQYPRDRIDKANEYLRNPELRLGATPDAWMGERLIECKVVSRPHFETWDNELPVYYKLQALTGMMLARVERAIVAVLTIETYNAQLELFHVDRDADLEAGIVWAVDRFWNMVESGELPPADYKLDAKLLAALFPPKADVAPLDLNGDNRLAEILAERKSLATAADRIEKRQTEIKTEVIDKLRGAPAAVCGSWRINHKEIHVREQFRPASSHLRLTISHSNGGNT